MSMTNATSPHENEYLAAIAGIHDQTPGVAVRNEPAVGDFVSGMTAGKRWSGQVEWVIDGRMCVNPGGAWLYVPVGDINTKPVVPVADITH